MYIPHRIKLQPTESSPPPAMYTSPSWRMPPMSGTLWLKPEQKLMLACLKVPACEMQKLGCRLLQHWAIPAAGTGSCGRWAGHTASTCDWVLASSWLSLLLNTNRLLGKHSREHWSYSSLISYRLVSYGWRGCKLISNIPQDIPSWVKEEVPLLLPVFFHSRNRWSNKGKNINTVC